MLRRRKKEHNPVDPSAQEAGLRADDMKALRNDRECSFEKDVTDRHELDETMPPSELEERRVHELYGTDTSADMDGRSPVARHVLTDNGRV